MDANGWRPVAGDKVFVEAEYIYDNIRNEWTLQLRKGICCFEVAKGFCITVPKSIVFIPPPPAQEEKP